MIQPGKRIGHIRIDGTLGEGGMGAVFVGFDEKLARPVALKTIRRDRLSAVARSRFLVEARLLSQLDHPNICRIYGFLENEGRDLLVLELIRGHTLRQALGAGIPPGARLVIAEKIARALESAHEKGIVHRDLKPDNVMITDRGEVKVLDFGLARLEVEDGEAGLPPEAASADLGPPEATAAIAATAPEGATEWIPSVSRLTQRGVVMGTITSMSPEQARGEPATAASDVYALGLLLQELFTGVPAYEEGLSFPLLLVKVADGDTLPLAGVKDPDLAALIRQLKALAPAARPTAAWAAGRLAWIRGKGRRRRLRLIAAAIAAAFLLGGVKYTVDLRQERQIALAARQKAEVEAERADTVAKFLRELFKASSPQEALGTVPDAREILRRGTERLGRDLQDQPLLRAELLDNLGSIYTDLGLFEEARPLLEESLAIRIRLRGPDHLEVSDSLTHLATTAYLSGKGDPVALWRRALRIRIQQVGLEDPVTAQLLNSLGGGFAREGDLDRAEFFLRRSLALHGRLWGEDLGLARVLHNLSGLALYRGQTEEAERLIHRALAIREARLSPDHPDLIGTREMLGLLLLDVGRADEGALQLQRAAESTERVFGPDHPTFARTLLNLGTARAAQGEDASAVRLYERALAIDEKTLVSNHESLLIALSHLGGHHLTQGRPAAAEPYLLRLLALREKSYSPDHPLVTQALGQVAALRLAQGRLTEAEALSERARTATRQRLARNPDNPTDRQQLAENLLVLGRICQARGEPARADESWHEALSLIAPLAAGTQSVDLRHAHALALLYLGRFDEARPIVRSLSTLSPRSPEIEALSRKYGLPG